MEGVYAGVVPFPSILVYTVRYKLDAPTGAAREEMSHLSIFPPAMLAYSV